MPVVLVARLRMIPVVGWSLHVHNSLVSGMIQCLHYICVAWEDWRPLIFLAGFAQLFLLNTVGLAMLLVSAIVAILYAAFLCPYHFAFQPRPLKLSP